MKRDIQTSLAEALGRKEAELEQAKEIIRELLEWEDRSDYGEHLSQSDPELLSKAEAFLNKE